MCPVCRKPIAQCDCKHVANAPPSSDGIVRISRETKGRGGKTVTILFSGDLGPDEKVFYNAPDAPSGFDYILSESTYGGRERVDYTLEQRREALKTEINEVYLYR